MKLDLFANRIEKVYFSAGVVRIDFCVLKPDAQGEVSPDTPVAPEDIHFSVTLPLGGFSRSMGELRKFAQELQSKGIIKKPQEEDRDQRRNRQRELEDLTSDDGHDPVV